MFTLLALLIACGGFVGGMSWERWSRGKTKLSDGYMNTVLPGKGVKTVRRIPGDFERKAALLLSSKDLLEYHSKVFVDIVSAVWRHIPVVCVARKQEQIDLAKKLLADNGLPRQSVNFVKIDMNTMWIRDYGPVFLKDDKGKNIILNGEYIDVDDEGVRWKDDDLPVALGQWFGVPVEDLPIQIEGGNLLSNGEGLIVTTTKIIAQNQQRGYDVEKLFRLFNEKMGAKRWVYVEELDGEPTGHADLLIAFLAPNVALVGQIDENVDPENSARLDRAARALSREMTSRGPLRVYRIPIPPVKDGIWRSYANSVLINGIALVPIYSDVDPELQAEALGLYKRLLPTWEIVGVSADSLVQNLGVLHCISQQVPSGISLKAILKADND